MQTRIVVLLFTFSMMCMSFVLGLENSIITELNSQRCIKEYQNKFSEIQYKELLQALDAPCRLRIMSYNILSKHYDRLQKKENTWENRKARVIALIEHDSPDILCCQELTMDQIADLMQSLDKKYALFAPLPCEQKYLTELLGIFYKRNRFTLQNGEKKELGSAHFSKELQSHCFQYFIKGKFIDLESKKEFVVYNTHADYLTPNGRIDLVNFLLKEAEKDAIFYPTILSGDFNTLPNMLPAPYKHPQLPALDSSYILQMMNKKCFRNASDLVLIGHAGPMATFTCSVENGEAFSGIEMLGPLLDHIFVTPDTIHVIFHAHEPATIDGNFPSDHIPVIVDLSIK